MMESSDSYEECFYPFQPHLEKNNDHWGDSVYRVDSTFAYLSSGTQREACAKIYKYNLATTVMRGYTNHANHVNHANHDKPDKQLQFGVLYELPVDILEKADHIKLGGTELWMLHQQCMSTNLANTKSTDDSKMRVALFGAILDRYREKESPITYFFQRWLCL